MTDTRVNKLQADAQSVGLAARAISIQVAAATIAARIVAASQINIKPRVGYFTDDLATLIEEIISLGFMVQADIVTAADAVSYLGSINRNDAAVMADARTLLGLFQVGDVSAMVDAVAIAMLNSQADGQSVVDAATVTAMTFLAADAQAIADARALLGLLSAADAVTSADAIASSLGRFTKAESSTMTDARTLLGQLSTADGLAALDASSFKYLSGIQPAARPGELWPGAARPGYAAMTYPSVAPPASNITFVKKPAVVATSGGGTSTTITHGAVAAGNLVVVMVANYADSTFTVAGSSGGSYTQAARVSTNGDNPLAIFYKANHPGATNEVITVTSGSSLDNYITTQSAEFSGALATTPLDKTGTAAGAAAATSTVVTASGANTVPVELVIAAGVANLGSSNLNWSTPSGFTLLGQTNDSNTYTGAHWSYKVTSALETSQATLAMTQPGAPDAIIATFKSA